MQTSEKNVVKRRDFEYDVSGEGEKSKMGAASKYKLFLSHFYFTKMNRSVKLI